MTDERRPDFRRERPGEFGKSGKGRPSLYQGERPFVEMPSAPVAIVPEKIIREGVVSAAVVTRPATVDPLSPPRAISVPKLKQKGLTRKEALFLQALVGSPTLIEAWRRAFPKDKTIYSNQRTNASNYHKRILAKLGEDGMFEAMGIGRQATMEKLRQLKDAKVVKAFIVPESGAIVEAGPYEDNTTQMNATKLLAQIHKMVDTEKGGPGGQVVVNVIQYAPPGAPPWPGGGRS